MILFLHFCFIMLSRNRNKMALEHPNFFKEWLRINFFSCHLRDTLAYDNVLDLCCGWGFYLKVNPQAWGVDIDSKCIEYLSGRGYNVKECNVIEELPFPENSFDLVLAHDALEHFTISQVECIFDNARRVLKKEGIFMVIIPNRKGYEYGIKIGSGHRHFITLKEIQQISTGRFVLKKSFHYPLPEFIGKHFTHNKEIILLKRI